MITLHGAPLSDKAANRHRRHCDHAVTGNRVAAAQQYRSHLQTQHRYRPEAGLNTTHHVLISWGKEQRHTAQVRAHDHTVLAARRRLGYTTEELIGQPVYSLILHHNSDDRHPSADQSQTNSAFTEQTVYPLTNEVFWRKDAYEELCLS